MQLVGGFANSSVFFHDLADGVLCIETASVYVFADDRAYISKYAAAASEELRSVQALEECRFVLVRFYQDGQVTPQT